MYIDENTYFSYHKVGECGLCENDITTGHDVLYSGELDEWFCDMDCFITYIEKNGFVFSIYKGEDVWINEKTFDIYDKETLIDWFSVEMITIE